MEVIPIAGPGSFNGSFRRRFAVVLAGCAVIAGALVTTPGIASARVIKPTITHFTASPSKVTDSDGTVTVSATVTNVNDNSDGCTLSSTPSLSNLPVSSNCYSGSFSQTVVVPLNSGKKTLKYKFTLTAVGQASKSEKKTVTVAKGDGRPPLSGVESVYGAATNSTDSPNTYCAVLAANGAVDCWGDNEYGELGYGSLSGPQNCGGTACALAPQSVVGVLGSGVLTGAQSLASAGNDTSFCALLTSGGVDCWGDDSRGELGNGTSTGTGVGIPSPVQVLGVGGPEYLSGVTSLVGGDEDYCALLNTGNVVCWGYGAGGQRGDGTDTDNVDSPVLVDVGLGTPLTGAVGLANDGGFGSYCAVLTGGGVDCWGSNTQGDLGNGTYGPDDCGGDGCSVFATQVVGIGDVGALSGVATVTGSYLGFCALVSGGVDCWGYNNDGLLGDGSYGGSSNSPVAVEGVGGSGTLSGVSSVATAVDAESDCALLTSGQVDCWGKKRALRSLGGR